MASRIIIHFLREMNKTIYSNWLLGRMNNSRDLVVTVKFLFGSRGRFNNELLFSYVIANSKDVKSQERERFS